MARLSAVVLATVFLGVAAAECEGQCSEEEEADTNSLLGLRAAAVHAHTNGPIHYGWSYNDAPGCKCNWIWDDDCKGNDDCARKCRQANPTGPCGPNGRAPIVKAGDCDCSWIPRDDCKGQDTCAKACRLANPTGPCGQYGFRDPRAPAPVLLETASGASRGYNDVGNCGCGWLDQDNCQSNDDCARKCRQGNPWGPCGSGGAPSPPAPTRKLDNVDNCDCSWIPRDDCRSTDTCATKCRQRNSWGPCGGAAGYVCDCYCQAERVCRGQPSSCWDRESAKCR